MPSIKLEGQIERPTAFFKIKISLEKGRPSALCRKLLHFFIPKTISNNENHYSVLFFPRLHSGALSYIYIYMYIYIYRERNKFENQSKIIKICCFKAWDYDCWVLLWKSFRTMDSILKMIHSVFLVAIPFNPCVGVQFLIIFNHI